MTADKRRRRGAKEGVEAGGVAKCSPPLEWEKAAAAHGVTRERSRRAELPCSPSFVQSQQACSKRKRGAHREREKECIFPSGGERRKVCDTLNERQVKPSRSTRVFVHLPLRGSWWVQALCNALWKYRTPVEPDYSLR